MQRNRDYTIEVDFFKTDPIESSISFKQYDYGTSNIRFLLKYKGEKLRLNENEKIISIFKYRNSIVANKIDESIQHDVQLLEDDGGIIVQIPQEILKNQGTVHCEIVIFNEVNGNRKTSPNITFSIIKSLIDFKDLNNGG